MHFSDGHCSGLGNCDKVLHSTYATALGQPLWKWGVLFYAILSSFALLACLKEQRKALSVCLALLTLGCAASLYFIYLQAFRIRAWCPLCLLSAGVQFSSLILSIILWKRTNKESSSKEPGYPALYMCAATAISLMIYFATTMGLRSIAKKFDALSSQPTENTLIAQIGSRELHLRDFTEYRTIKREFDQFIWNKAKEWYRAEILTEAAKQQGFKSSTEFVYKHYTDAGGLIDIDAEETRRRFEKLKNEYLAAGSEVPSDEDLFQELQNSYQKQYEDFVAKLAVEQSKEMDIPYILKPPVINLPLDPANLPLQGPQSAPIKIVEISDYHCSFCRKMHQSVKDVIKEIGSENVQLAFVNHHWDEIPDGLTPELATLAMRAGYAAWKQEKFWKFTQEAFEKQSQIDLYNRADLLKIAANMNLEMERFEQDMESPEAQEFLNSQKELQKMAHADKPPTLLVNGFYVKADRKSILAKINELGLLKEKE